MLSPAASSDPRAVHSLCGHILCPSPSLPDYESARPALGPVWSSHAWTPLAAASVSWSPPAAPVQPQYSESCAPEAETRDTQITHQRTREKEQITCLFLNA